MVRFDVLIVGAGHAGAQAAIVLRQQKFAGSIGLLGDEGHLPYERPLLSKSYLQGTKVFDQLLVRPADFWPGQRIELLHGRVVSVDPQRHEVGLADGGRIGFGKLIWAAGGLARQLRCPGAQLQGVHTLRARSDVDRLRVALGSSDRVVIIGGGYIGLEVASTLTRLSKRVTIVETADRVLSRVAGEPLSRFYEQEHRARGVEIRLATTLAAIEQRGERALDVRLASGETLAADLIVVGIGIAPCVEPLREAGAAMGDGVEVDDQCRTSLPGVFAIGDCASHRNPFGRGAPIRLESVQNATDQAIAVARVIAGQDFRYNTIPWFWSEQYDLRLQTVGLSSGHDDVVVRGDPATRAFSVAYLKQGRVVAFDCVNNARDYMQARALILNGARPDRAAVADPGIALKTLLSTS